MSLKFFGRAVYAALFCCVLFSTTVEALERKPLTIVTVTGRHPITVEIATTPEEKARGLMYRRSLAANVGMLFVYAHDQEIMMWMKNTYISLDMIFIKADGTVLRIEENTKPLSERIISSEQQARAILEMKAGSAARLGIKAGDKIEYAGF
jgi:uncharacterized membrane protein (UPF0127 family)